MARRLGPCGGIAVLPFGLNLDDVRLQGSAVGLDDLAGPRTAVWAQVSSFEDRAAVSHRHPRRRLLYRCRLRDLR